MAEAILGSDARATARQRVGVPVKILASLHIAFALAGLVAGLSACVGFWLIPGRFSNTILAFAIPIFLFFAIFLFLPEVAGAVALLFGKPWGRIVIFLISGLMMFVVPVGTAIGAFGIRALLSDRSVPVAETRRRVAPRGGGEPVVTGAYVAATLLVLIALGAAGIILLAVAFRFRELDPPPAIHDLFAGATVALPGALILAAVTIAVSRHRRAKAAMPDADVPGGTRS